MSKEAWDLLVFSLSITIHLLEEENEEKGRLTRESRTSMTRSAILRRSRMARLAAAIWPGNQLMTPPLALNPISAIRFPTFATTPIPSSPSTKTNSYYPKETLNWRTRRTSRRRNSFFPLFFLSFFLVEEQRRKNMMSLCLCSSISSPGGCFRGRRCGEEKKWTRERVSEARAGTKLQSKVQYDGSSLGHCSPDPGLNFPARTLLVVGPCPVTKPWTPWILVFLIVLLSYYSLD